MGFLIIIFTRLLFIACMVFIIGYVFGPFAGKPVLRTITRVAAILAVVLFFTVNAFSFRGDHARVHDGPPWCHTPSEAGREIPGTLSEGEMQPYPEKRDQWDRPVP